MSAPRTEHDVCDCEEGAAVADREGVHGHAMPHGCCSAGMGDDGGCTNINYRPVAVCQHYHFRVGNPSLRALFVF